MIDLMRYLPDNDPYALQARIMRLELENTKLQQAVRRLTAILAYADAREEYRRSGTTRFEVTE